MRPLTSLVALHDVHWAMELRTAHQIWQALQSTTVEIHLAEVAQRDTQALGEDGEPRSAREDDRPYDVSDGVAIVSLVGPMTKATTSMGSGCSTVAARRQVRAAAADPDVRAIMLRIDSPGGSVSGTADLAEDVRAAAARKPTMAYCEDLCCSAAYWVAAQCGTIVSNATAMVGSIGTYCVIADYSGMFEAAGVKVHVVSTGDHKGAGAMGAPITPEQLAEFQGEVNDLNAHFLGAVSKGRKMPMAQVRQVADGRVFVGQKAKALGLVDGVGTFDQALADLRNSVGRIGARAEIDPIPVALAAALTHDDPILAQETVLAVDPTPAPAAEDEPPAPEPAPASDPEPEPAVDPESSARVDAEIDAALAFLDRAVALAELDLALNA